MLVIGLTGGIGSGKTTVAEFFQEQGVEIIDSDLIAREVVAPRTPCLAAIRDHFGDDILLPDGSLNRKRLREIIFADAEAKRWLEALLHPVIRQRTREKIDAARGPYVILAIPLLLETRDRQRVDRILVVDVPREQQIARTLARDQVARSQLESTLAAQVTREKRLASTDDVIDNSATPAHTKAQVLRLHDTYLKLAGKTHSHDD